MRFIACLLALFLAMSATGLAQGTTPRAGTVVRGTLVDQQSNLGIAGASVSLVLDGGVVASVKADASGAFAFAPQLPGTYQVVVTAAGYVQIRSQPIQLQAADATASVALVLEPSAGGAGSQRVIGSVSTSTNTSAALQTTATITRRADPVTSISENIARVGQALEFLPGVNLRNKNTTIGDDLTVDIRGMKPSETQTLLDGHPIGPIGVQPGTNANFNFQDSPPFALRSILTTYGAGSLGLYGTNSTGGSVDLQTWDPTPDRRFFFEQGVGDQGKLFTNLRATGQAGKLGYALVYATQGTYGPFAPQNIFQNGNLGTNFTTANILKNTYSVSANYLLRNDLAKLRWDFSPQTHLTVTAYVATSYDDKSGNGDNDSTSYPYQSYIAPVGKAASCPAGVSVQVDSGTQCLTQQQWAAATTGPQGAYGAFQTIGNQDYHARFTTTIGKQNITLDQFLDAYNLIYNRNLASYNAAGNYYNGGYYQNVYHTAGFLASDDIISNNNQFGFGYYVQHQSVTGNTYADPLLIPRQPAALANANVFLRDAFTASSKLSFYGNVWLKESSATHGSTIDPRLSAVFRPTSSDVIRAGFAKSEGDPDPSLASGNLNTTPTNLNPPCGAFKNNTGQRLNVGQIGNPQIGPETATDMEVAYSHRFGGDSIINIDAYNTNESNQIFNASFSAALFPGQIPAALLSQYFAVIQNLCNTTPTLDNLALTQASNFSNARFRGIEISGRIRINRQLYADYSYDMQSAAQTGVPDALLASNLTIINGSQIVGIPLHKQSLALDYSTPGGIEARIDGEHLDAYNGLNRPGYTYADGFVRYAAPRGTSLSFGVYNIFQTAVLSYGQIGLGTFTAENQFGRDATAFDQAVKLRGLTPRSFVFSLSQRF